MGMDKNTVIGFVLIGALLITMFIINSRSNQAYMKEKQRVEDSIAATKPKVDLVAAQMDSLKTDSLQKAKLQLPAVFITDRTNSEHFDTLENEVIKITFTNKGGQPKTVELKQYKRFDGKPIVLENGTFNKLSYQINTGVNLTSETSDISFVSANKNVAADKTQSISFILKDSTGKEIVHQYSLKPDSYILDFDISINGADRLISKNTLNLLWQTEAPQVEKDIPV